MIKRLKNFLIPVVFVIVFIFALFFIFYPLIKNELIYSPHRGDIVFQSLPPMDLVVAIEGITQSKYSHCGIVDKTDGKWCVIESIGNVHVTPLSTWMRRGINSGIDVYRMNINDEAIEKSIEEAKTFIGLPYDIKYEMDDQKIYCSELVYKSFKLGAGLEMGKFDLLGELNWKPYKVTIEKYEHGPVPIDRKMITPIGLTRDDKMKLVYSSY
jgi:hypothetical protein